ncbi:MAG TPA: HlyD family efflux transporter periplasmic adaptor subunit [Alphaproteobacteria bacterium]|nr:HlyD family efflux transporter periplasmic adaptor subunit [Alphaproteobacteria bacterium]HNS44261.1 HlyD family efflux transporter periplasmic adaptor subunit [Alphaproteobacteria bacterium]
MDKLLSLLTLQRQAQEAATRNQLMHIISNESRKLVPYRQCVVWSKESWGGITLDKISGNATLDANSQYALDLKKTIAAQKFSTREIVEIKKTESLPALTLAPIITAQDGLLGGLCLETETPLTEVEKELLKELALSYAPSMALFAVRGSGGLWRSLSSLAVERKYILLLLCVLALFPTRLTITAPVEIVPEDAEIITAPFNGIVKSVEVTAGEGVTSGDTLVVMDNTSLKADAELAGQDLKIFESQLSKAHREALSAPDKRSDLGILEAERKEKEIKLHYANEMQGKSAITAKRDGVAIYTDKTALEGQPVQAGDVLMRIADPEKYELLIRIPVGALVPFDRNAPVSFFLGVNPTRSYDANISSIGYEASPDEDGLLTYKVRAKMTEDKKLRIGWQGTAHIKGGWTILAYAVLRRPILSLRQMTGI